MTTLEEYYNKFNEDKRLDSRHGRVEFQTSMHYIHKYLDQIAEETGKNRREIRILDIGAGTGRYSIALAEEGYDVTAVELVKHNLGRLKQKCSIHVCTAVSSGPRKVSFTKRNWIVSFTHLPVRTATEPD